MGKVYNLSRVFKTDISAMLIVVSGLDPHRLVFLNKKRIADGYGDYGLWRQVGIMVYVSFTLMFLYYFIYGLGFN